MNINDIIKNKDYGKHYIPFNMDIKEVMVEENIGKEFRGKFSRQFGGGEINLILLDTHPIKLKITQDSGDLMNRGRYINDCYSFESIINMRFQFLNYWDTMKTIVILNEQHSLLERQKYILETMFRNFEVLQVPSEGWTKEEQITQCDTILDIWGKEKNKGAVGKKVNVVFASPVPVLLSCISKHIGMQYKELTENVPSELCRFVFNNDKSSKLCGFVFHNDKREKKELPNGKIIFTVAEEGWQLVEI